MSSDESKIALECSAKIEAAVQETCVLKEELMKARMKLDVLKCKSLDYGRDAVIAKSQLTRSIENTLKKMKHDEENKKQLQRTFEQVKQECETFQKKHDEMEATYNASLPQALA